MAWYFFLLTPLFFDWTRLQDLHLVIITLHLWQRKVHSSVACVRRRWWLRWWKRRQLAEMRWVQKRRALTTCCSCCLMMWVIVYASYAQSGLEASPAILRTVRGCLLLSRFSATWRLQTSLRLSFGYPLALNGLMLVKASVARCQGKCDTWKAVNPETLLVVLKVFACRMRVNSEWATACQF